MSKTKPGNFSPGNRIHLGFNLLIAILKFNTLHIYYIHSFIDYHFDTQNNWVWFKSPYLHIYNVRNLIVNCRSCIRYSFIIWQTTYLKLWVASWNQNGNWQSVEESNFNAILFLFEKSFHFGVPHIAFHVFNKILTRFESRTETCGKIKSIRDETCFHRSSHFMNCQPCILLCICMYFTWIPHWVFQSLVTLTWRVWCMFLCMCREKLMHNLDLVLTIPINHLLVTRCVA